MRDVDDADAACGQVADKPEELIRFVVGEAGRGFVEDQDREIRSECLGDFDHLLFGAAHMHDLAVRAQVEGKLGEDAFGFAAHVGAVEEDTLCVLGAEEEVFLDRHLRNEGKLLKYRRDTVIARVMDGVERDGFAVTFDVPGAGRIGAGQH